MSLWSLHPKYLDKQSLISLWKNALSVQKALLDNQINTNSQLDLFRTQDNPLRAIGSYLSFIASEGAKRGYKLGHEKINHPGFDDNIISVKSQQIVFEMKHLKQKLKIRDKEKFRQLNKATKIELNPVFFAPQSKDVELISTKTKIDSRRYA